MREWLISEASSTVLRDEIRHYAALTPNPFLVLSS
jgi:hypothetical protein